MSDDRVLAALEKAVDQVKAANDSLERIRDLLAEED